MNSDFQKELEWNIEYYKKVSKNKLIEKLLLEEKSCSQYIDDMDKLKKELIEKNAIIGYLEEIVRQLRVDDIDRNWLKSS
tara:strand:- start:12072 stop:12311 length:240 start_codon:yes stop_codon:yes gene_type:complete